MHDSGPRPVLQAMVVVEAVVAMGEVSSGVHCMAELLGKPNASRCDADLYDVSRAMYETDHQLSRQGASAVRQALQPHAWFVKSTVQPAATAVPCLRHCVFARCRPWRPWWWRRQGQD